ncbi:MAG: hypothetical protein ACI83D_000004 [Planctomycetota bacterium]|jgi:hypothetical protein
MKYFYVCIFFCIVSEAMSGQVTSSEKTPPQGIAKIGHRFGFRMLSVLGDPEKTSFLMQYEYTEPIPDSKRIICTEVTIGNNQLAGVLGIGIQNDRYELKIMGGITGKGITTISTSQGGFWTGKHPFLLKNKHSLEITPSLSYQGSLEISTNSTGFTSLTNIRIHDVFFISGMVITNSIERIPWSYGIRVAVIDKEGPFIALYGLKPFTETPENKRQSIFGITAGVIFY